MSEEATQATNSVTKSEKGFWARFMDHPWYVRVSTTAGIASLVTGFYFYWASIQSPKLCYAISPTRTPILKAGKLSNLKVRYEARTSRVDLVQTNPFAYNPNFVGPMSVRTYEFQDRDVTNDLTGVQIAIWNAGNRPIHSNDILLPVILHSTDKSAILEASIKRTNSGTAMSLRHDLVDNEIKLDWRVLEKNDGGLITLFYEGSEDIDFVLDGKIEGQGAPVYISRRRSEWIVNATCAVGTIALMVILDVVGIKIKGKRFLAKRPRILTNYPLLVNLPIVVVWFFLAYKFILPHQNVTPFGF